MAGGAPSSTGQFTFSRFGDRTGSSQFVFNNETPASCALKAEQARSELSRLEATFLKAPESHP